MTEPAPLSPPEQEQLIQRIGRTIVSAVPPKWHQARVTFRSAGTHRESYARVIAPNTTVIPLAVPPGLEELFHQLRAGMYEPTRGTWLSALYQLQYPSSYHVDFDGDHEPEWATPPPAGSYAAELRLFPRAADQLPEWLSTAGTTAGVTTGSSEPAPSAETLRRAEVFDGEHENGTPFTKRPDITHDEHEPLVRYLEDAPIVLAARSYDADRLDPDRTSAVPLTFHTDGTWVWAGAVGYYLRAHGVPPEPDLVEHARVREFRIPEVDERLRDHAVATVTGHTTA